MEFDWIDLLCSNQKVLQAIAVDLVLLTASIQQAASIHRIAGNSCIGIFHTTLWNFLEDSTASVGST